MPLPLTVSCFSKIQIGFTFLVPAHLGSPSKRAIKRMCVCVLSHKAIPIFPYKTVWDRWNKASTTKPSLIGPAVSIQHLLVTDRQKDSPHISGGRRWLSRRQPVCLQPGQLRHGTNRRTDHTISKCSPLGRGVINHNLGQSINQAGR